MAEDKKVPETPASPVGAKDEAPKQPEPKVTDNPGEGTHMFSDWALI